MKLPKVRVVMCRTWEWRYLDWGAGILIDLGLVSIEVTR